MLQGAAPLDGTQACDEFRRPKRPRHIHIRAGLDRLCRRGRISFTVHDHDMHRAPAWKAANDGKHRSCERVASDQDDIGRVRDVLSSKLRWISDPLRTMTLVPEHRSERLGVLLIAVKQQNEHRGREGRPRSLGQHWSRVTVGELVLTQQLQSQSRPAAVHRTD